MNAFSSPRRPSRGDGSSPSRVSRFSSSRRARRDTAARRPGLPPPRADGNADAEAGTLSLPLTACLRVLPLSAGVGLLLLLLAAGAAYASPDPDPLILPLGLAASALTSLFTGAAAVRCAKRSPCACGLISGVLLSLLLLTGGLILHRVCPLGLTELPPAASWGMHGGVILLSLLGSLIARPRARKPSHTPRRH